MTADFAFHKSRPASIELFGFWIMFCYVMFVAKSFGI